MLGEGSVIMSDQTSSPSRHALLLLCVSNAGESSVMEEVQQLCFPFLQPEHTRKTRIHSLLLY